jgi:PilZ domain
MAHTAIQRQPEPDTHSEPDIDSMASRRKFARYPTHCPAVCILPGQAQQNVTIINASQGGFGLSCDLPVPEGTQIVISIPQIGDFLGAVVWKNGERCGVELLTEAGWLDDEEAKRLASGLSRVDSAIR